MSRGFVVTGSDRRVRLWPLMAAVSLAIALLVAGVAGAPSALAGGWTLCSGYAGCRSVGYSDSGYEANSGRSYWGMYAGHNCTNYVAYRIVANGGPGSRPWPQQYGNAADWGAGARVAGYVIDDRPVVGAVAWYASNHVAYVEQVVSDSEIVTSEDNWGGDFHWMRRTRANGWPTGFIHIKDVGTPGPAAGSPIGHVDDAVGLMGGGAWVRGWVADRDAPGSAAPIHVYVDGPAGSGAQGYAFDGAAMYRPDVDQVFPGLGSFHGFSFGLKALPSGGHTLYVYGINVAGPGENPLLGAVPITIPATPSGSPRGNNDGAAADWGAIRVAGWSFDPDSPTMPTNMHAYLDTPAGFGGRGVDLGAASVARPDVAAVFPQAGPAHGLNAWFTGIDPGQHTVFLYAINRAGSGENPFLGAATVVVPGGSPGGSFDAAVDAHESIVVRGWAVDPDVATRSIDIHAYLDGPAGSGARFVGLGAASTTRTDVATVHPGAGSAHGFDVAISGVQPGPHSVYVYAINAAGTSGGNVMLGQRTVTVTPKPSPPPASPAPVRVATSVRLVGPAAVRVAARFSVAARASAAARGRPVRLQWWNGTRWVWFATARLSSRAVAGWRVSVRSRGVVRLRAVVPGWSGHATGLSATLRVRVR